jgi:hypothetical protein
MPRGVYCGLLLAAGGVVTAGAGMVEVEDAGGVAGFEVPRSLDTGGAVVVSGGVGAGPAASGLAAGAGVVVAAVAPDAAGADCRRVWRARLEREL